MSNLVHSAVFVKVSGPDPKTLKTKHRSFFSVDSGVTTLSCSGLVCTDGKILTSAWLLAPFITEHHRHTLITGATIDVCGENGVWKRAKLVKTCRRSDRVQIAIRELTGTDELEMRGISCLDLAVLSCDCSDYRPIVVEKLFDVKPVDRGIDLFVISSSFGLVSPSVFRNSVTKGVLSNVISSSPIQGDVLLTDARCLAGSEGAPVFDTKNRFVGMVLPTPSRGNGMPLELGVIVPFNCFWNECVEEGYEKITSSLSSTVPAKAAKSVALIRVGGNWGSGVLIHKSSTGDGLVVTCAHVVRSSRETSEAISLSFRGGRQVVNRFAVMLFCSEGPVDFAMLSVSRLPSWMEPLPLAQEDDFQLGDYVTAIGHALFEPASMGGKHCTMSTGTLCKVVPVEIASQQMVPVLLQTSASVFRGHSGGLLCNQKGQFVGIVTSNAKHSDGSIIPEINFSIPISCIRSVIEDYLVAETMSLKQRKEVFQKFHNTFNENIHLKLLWGLQPVENIGLSDGPNGGGEKFRAFFERFVDSKL